MIDNVAVPAAQPAKKAVPLRERWGNFVQWISEKREQLEYFERNLASVLPSAIALLVVVLASQLMAVSRDGCGAIAKSEATGAGHMPRVNPVICPDTEVLRDAFGEIDTKGAGGPRYKFPLYVAAARDANKNESDKGGEKSQKDAEAEVAQANAIHDIYKVDPPKDNGKLSASESFQAHVNFSKQLAESVKNQATATNRRDEANIKLVAIRAKAAAAERAATYTVLLSEARGRILWFSSLGLSLAVALGTLCAMTWIFLVAMGDHFLPEKLGSDYYNRAAKLIGLMVVSFLALAIITWVGYIVIHRIIFGKLDISIPWPALNKITYNESLLSSFFFSEKDRLPKMLDTSNLLVIAAVSAIAAAVTVILYQHPEQARSRETNVPKNSDGTNKSVQSMEDYKQFLARCFDRLSVAIYFGAVLLVVCVVRISAGYSWLFTLLEPGPADEPTKASSPMVAAFTALADQYTFAYGLIFTLVLTGLFLPAWIVLRRRAWQVARTRELPGKEKRTLQDDENWLEQEGLSFTKFQHSAQIFALLAPLGAGTVITALKGLVGS